MTSESITMENHIDECYLLMINLIQRASTLAMEGYNSRDLKVEIKNEEEWNVVTAYDKEIENMFINEISSKFSNHRYLNIFMNKIKLN